MFIDSKLLEEKRACIAGKTWFEEHFPNGSDYQELLYKLAEENHINWARWALHKFGAIDTVLEVSELNCEASVFFAGRILVSGAIKVSKWILSGGGIEAGEGIKAGRDIEAGEDIKAGRDIKAGGDIEVGEDFGIYAGLRLRLSSKKQYAIIHAQKQPKNIVCGDFVQVQTKQANEI